MLKQMLMHLTIAQNTALILTTEYGGYGDYEGRGSLGWHVCKNTVEMMRVLITAGAKLTTATIMV